jgi:hypothetical protein
MKLERTILACAWLMLVSGFVVWAVGGAQLLRSLGIWLWLGGAGVLSLPLLFWLADVLFRAVRR